MTTGAWCNSVIGSYRLDELVGAGGMGEVYRAVQLSTGRTVAVKVLTGAAGMPGVVERFRNEARVQAAMRHPHIALLHELVEVQQTPCIVMEFVDGETLGDRLRRNGALPAAEALCITAQVVDAVGYLHDHQVIHRDIKAANVKVNAAGQVKLLDFGIAKGPDSPSLTRTGNVVGTLQSLAPEQLEHGRADWRTDIWAIGVLMHELLTNRHPFADEGMFGITDRIRAGRYRAPSRLNPLLPSAVDRIVARCLKVEPAQRYPSCAALQDDVQALLAPSGEIVPTRSATDAAREFARANGVLGAILVGAVAVVVLGWTVLTPVARTPGAHPAGPPRATGERARAVGGQAEPTAIARDDGSPTPPTQRVATEPAVSVREVTVNTLNGTADVYQNGQRVGRTPYLLRQPLGSSVSLVLRRAGFEDAPVRFDVTEGRRAYSVVMRQQDGSGGAVPPARQEPAGAGWLGLPLLGWLRRRRNGADVSLNDDGVGVTGMVPLAGGDEVPGEAELVVGLLSDVGCVREVNEDSVRVVRPTGTAALGQRGLLAVVCDGMGGHAAGETASGMAVEVVARCYANGGDDPGAALAHAVQRANHDVYEAAHRDRALAGMGTTCTAVVLRGGRAWCAHVGDSRCYLLRDRQLYLMTEDHSAVMQLVRERSLSRDDARHHPDRNVVSRAIGSQRQVEVSVWPRPFVMRPGDRLLLSTDGLHDLLDEAELCSAAAVDPPQQACRRLVELARERGAPDNVSVIVLELPARRPASVSAGPTRDVPVLPAGTASAAEPFR